MQMTVRLFAILRERAGRDEVTVELPDSATVADAMVAIAALPGLASVSTGSARMAVNREYAVADTPLRAGDELALIPPVSGGADPLEHTRVTGPVWARITAARLELDELVASVMSDRAGAVVTFQGLPRDIPVLDYEAYGEMALAQLTSILTDCVKSHDLIAAAVAHRVGSVPARQASIIIAASAPHRDAAFRGAREALDTIKAQAPIWKVEVGADGDRSRVSGVLPR